MISHPLILVWLLVTPFTGAALALLGALVIARLPAPAREEAAPAPHYLAVGICLLLLVQEALLLPMGRAVSGDFHWTRQFAQVRVLLDRTVFIFLPVITLAGLAAAAAAARRPVDSPWSLAVRQAAVLLALGFALLAAVASDLVLIAFALGAAALCSWWAAGVGEEGGEQHQVLGTLMLGVALVMVELLLAFALTRDEYLPGAGVGMLMFPTATVRLVGLLAIVGFGGVTSGLLGLSWSRQALRAQVPAAYLPLFCAASLLMLRVSTLLLPRFALPGLAAVMLYFPVLAMWVWLVPSLLKLQSRTATHRLWSGLGAVALTSALVAWFGPGAAVSQQAVTIASAAALLVGAVALGMFAPAPIFRPCVVALGLGGVVLVGIPLAQAAWVHVGGVLGALIAPTPLLIAVAFAALWRSQQVPPHPARLTAGLLTFACLALAIALQFAPGWLGTPPLPGD